MEYIEYKRDLPSNLVIPWYRPTEVRSYDDRVCYWGILTPEGYVKIFNKTEDITIRGPKEFIKAFTQHRYTFIVMSVNHISLLFRGFPDENKEDMHIYPHLGTTVEDYTISRAYAHARKINIRKGGKWWSVVAYATPAHQLTPSVDPEDIITQFVEDLPKKVGIQPSTVSLASAWRDFLFGPTLEDGIHEQFTRVHKLAERRPDVLEGYYNACKRPIMSTAMIGPIPTSREEDMKTAYLTALYNMPSMSTYDTSEDESPIYDPDALFANYFVKVTMPPMFKFTPNNFRASNDELGYGTYACTGGPQILHIGQRRARQWTGLGIKFDIISAHKILPAGGIRHPWKKRVNMISAMMTPEVQQQFKWINFQELYYKATGSLLHMHDTYTAGVGVTWVTFPCFNPILMCDIYELVDIANWSRLQESPADKQVAQSIDANTVIDHPAWKEDPKGMFRAKGKEVGPTERFFPNPRNKDKNIAISAPYRDVVKQAAKKSEGFATIEKVTVVTWELISEGKANAEDEGKRIPTKHFISTGGENRLTNDKNIYVKPERIVDDTIEVRDPDVSELRMMESHRLPVGDFDYEWR